MQALFCTPFSTVKLSLVRSCTDTTVSQESCLTCYVTLCNRVKSARKRSVQIAHAWLVFQPEVWGCILGMHSTAELWDLVSHDSPEASGNPKQMPRRCWMERNCVNGTPPQGEERQQSLVNVGAAFVTVLQRARRLKTHSVPGDRIRQGRKSSKGLRSSTGL